MIVRLVGHDYKYAVEQISLALFPYERINYSHDHVAGSCEPLLESRLSLGGSYAQATTIIRKDGKISRGVARIRRGRLSGKLETDRLSQRIIKQSFYRAAMAFVETPPVWGSLTGIRPAKLAEAALEAGASEKAAAKMLSKEFYVAPERAQLCIGAARAALALGRALLPRDVALYIGIPFCPTRCAYCSFVSNSVEKSFDLVAPFVQTLLGEISDIGRASKELGLRVVAVYIGGGTPTSLPAEALGSIMQALHTAFDFSNALEYTVEAGRPDTITGEKLEVIRRMGAGRVCVNPQSMSADVLAAIGRRHTPEETLDAALLVRKSGMLINMDIIAGLPGDSAEGFDNTLHEVLSIMPENITVHTLSLKKGSRIMLDRTETPDGGQVSEMLSSAFRQLRDRGYAPYYLYEQKYTSGGFENTGWSLPGREGIYNICMMEELCSVLALGGGGVTKLVSRTGRIERVFNAKYPLEYIRQAEKTAGKIERIKDFFKITPI